MFFKKYKIKTTQEKPKIIPYTIGIIGIFFVCFIGVRIVDTLGAIELQVMWVNEKQEEGNGILGIFEDNTPDSTSTSKPINILLLGRWGGDHDAPDLTDTIILASINSQKNAISLLSIPRDLYVAYPGSTKSWKINRIYETFLYRNSKEVALEKIKEKVSEITGQEVDFYVNVDFEGFVEIINILWGVEVTVPENFVDYEYPDGKLGYTTFILRKWTWTLDGDVALKYARSRHSTSDFDRSLRQQQILNGIKNKILSLGYIKDSWKIRWLFWAIEKYIDTDIDIATLVKLAIDFKSGGDKSMFSFNLNDTCFESSPICSKWGFLYIPQREFFWGKSVVLAEWSNVSSLSEYSVLETYMSLIFEHQDIFTENIPIAVYNSTKTKFLARWLSDVLKKYWFNIPGENAVGNIREKKFEKSILYYNGIDANSATLLFLQETLDIDIEKVESPLFSNDGVYIEIVLWSDFNEIKYLDIK